MDDANVWSAELSFRITARIELDSKLSLVLKVSRVPCRPLIPCLSKVPTKKIFKGHSRAFDFFWQPIFSSVDCWTKLLTCHLPFTTALFAWFLWQPVHNIFILFAGKVYAIEWELHARGRVTYSGRKFCFYSFNFDHRFSIHFAHLAELSLSM